MVIVAMQYIGLMLPVTKPVNESNLKCNKALCIVAVAINIFAIEQAVNIDEEIGAGIQCD